VVEASAYRVQQREYLRRWRSEVPGRRDAHALVRLAVVDGKLPEPTACDCFVCGGQAKQYHHIDYDKPLEVFPMCVSCHQGWHGANKKPGSPSTVRRA
jgi:hypothetical protein